MARSPEHEHPVKAFGWAARDQSGVLTPFNFSRRATGERDVTFKVVYCGVCHSDLHFIKNEWGFSNYPLLPGTLLKSHGKLVIVGGPERPLELPVMPLLQGRKILAGSGIGGMKETREMIDFATEHNIKPDIEVIPMEYINTAMERPVKADVRYRFFIDIENTLKSA